MTLQLESGEILRLSGIEIPDYKPSSPGEHSLLTMKILNDMLRGKQVNIHQTPNKKLGRKNRMNHLLAHIERKDDKLWVQGTLLSLGLARVRTRQYTPHLAKEMYAIENKARLEKAAIWAIEKYFIKAPTDLDGSIDQVHIIQGRVESVAQNNGNIYINFGKNWRTDFTAMIRSEHKKIFYKAGLDPMNWGGEILQLRGWLDSYNGPMLTLSHPEAVQVISVGNDIVPGNTKKKKKP